MALLIPGPSSESAVKPPSHAFAEYRPDIDGLRAVAILGVLIFHANPAWLTGGFAGVDVFFVISGFLISGFLISGIIFRELKRGRFSCADFYARRALVPVSRQRLPRAARGFCAGVAGVASHGTSGSAGHSGRTDMSRYRPASTSHVDCREEVERSSRDAPRRVIAEPLPPQLRSLGSGQCPGGPDYAAPTLDRKPSGPRSTNVVWSRCRSGHPVL